MSGTYLFFDIECANNVSSEGYICSFGYVLCDERLAVIKSDDIVMNPRIHFDEMLLRPDSKCFLSYSKEYFLRQPDFSHHYEAIRDLLTTPGCTPVGFAVENDIDFMVCACKHFSKEQILFAAYDIHAIARKLDGSPRALGGWMDFYHLDVSALTAHNSRDDAMMTLLLAQAVCRRQGVTLDALLGQHPDALHTVQEAVESRRFRAYRKYMRAEIASLYGRRNDSPRSRRCAGRYMLALSGQRDLEQAYDISRMIFDNGGILVSRLKPGCVYVMEDDRAREEWMDQPRFAAVRFIHLKDLYARAGAEEPPFKAQTRDVPDLDAQFRQYTV